MASIVIAPDKFKGSLTAAQVAHHLAAGLHRVRPDLDIRQVPMADGGEGTVEAALAAGYAERTATVRGPLGAEGTARYAVSSDGVTAVIELALASGLSMTRADVDAARRSSSVGTGDLVVDAVASGVRRIVLGVGGSASTDGGAGLVSALGVRLLDAEGRELPGGGAALADLATVDLGGLDGRLRDVEVVLAADVSNPLRGPEGAAAVYGPQKGADPAAVAGLEEGLRRWVAALSAAGVPEAVELSHVPGAGAAGGVGYAALALLGATRRPGIDVVMELTRLDDALAGSDLAITGEGSLDVQSLFGKVPVGVAAAAARAGVPVVAVAGRCLLTAGQLDQHGIGSAYALTDVEPDVGVCIAQAGRLLERLAADILSEHLTRERN